MRIQNSPGVSHSSWSPKLISMRLIPTTGTKTIDNRHFGAYHCGLSAEWHCFDTKHEESIYGSSGFQLWPMAQWIVAHLLCPMMFPCAVYVRHHVRTYHISQLWWPIQDPKKSAKQKHKKKVKQSVKDLQRIKPKFKANQQVKTCSAPPASLPCVSIGFFSGRELHKEGIKWRLDRYW